MRGIWNSIWGATRGNWVAQPASPERVWASLGESGFAGEKRLIGNE